MIKRREPAARHEKRLFNISEATAYTGLGSTTFRRWAAEIGAVHKIGTRALYDRAVIDRELDRAAAAAESVITR